MAPRPRQNLHLEMGLCAEAFFFGVWGNLGTDTWFVKHTQVHAGRIAGPCTMAMVAAR